MEFFNGSREHVTIYNTETYKLSLHLSRGVYSLIFLFATNGHQSQQGMGKESIAYRKRSDQICCCLRKLNWRQ